VKWVVDTNVISEMKRPRPNAAVVKWYAAVGMETLFTTTVNIAEIRAGIAESQNAPHAVELSTWLATVIRPFYQGRILEASEGALVRWHQLRLLVQANRQSNPPVDVLIAAIALENGACIATRDVDGFIPTGVPTFNPWTGERFNGA
jgi:toxin FitB